MLDNIFPYILGGAIIILSVVLAAFKTGLKDKILFLIRKTHLRQPFHKDITTAIESYLLSAKLSVEMFEHKLMSHTLLTSRINEYNDAFTKLNTNKQTHTSSLKIYWGVNQLESYALFLASVTHFDKAIHSLNDELDAVLNTKTKTEVDPERIEETLALLTPTLADMNQRSEVLFDGLL